MGKAYPVLLYVAMTAGWVAAVLCAMDTEYARATFNLAMVVLCKLELLTMDVRGDA